MSDAKLKNPSVLAFEGKLVPSDALMFSGRWQGNMWQPLNIQEKSVRGTISNRLKAAMANDPTKVDAEVSKPNIQTVDNAALPHDSDTLKVHFTLRILGDLNQPSTCNNPDYQAALATLIELYQQEQGFGELAKRYATNIANGRFLWRNRVGAEAINIAVEVDGETHHFDAYTIPVRNFNDVDVSALADVIERGLSGSGYAFLNINAFVKMGEGQPVYPSQELVMGGVKGDKRKFLYQTENGQAAMHSQKIGNAIRTIDTWHKAAEEVGPIAVEPYGSVTNRGIAYRQPKEKTDFYNLLDSWLLKGKEPELAQKHYIMAMLIRGGVFGE